MFGRLKGYGGNQPSAEPGTRRNDCFLINMAWCHCGLGLRDLPFSLAVS